MNVSVKKVRQFFVSKRYAHLQESLRKGVKLFPLLMLVLLCTQPLVHGMLSA